jgi:hypothetical protein
MDDFIVTTTDSLKRIIRECLAELNQTNQSLPEPEATKYLYSIQELADFLGCSKVTAQKLKNSGKIRFKQFSRKCIFSSSEVLEDLNYRQRKVK